MISILKTSRIGLISHIINFLNFCGFKYNIIDGSILPPTQIVEKIKNSKIVIFSNGTDKKDLDIQRLCHEQNINCKFIFSEFAWFTWNKNIYFDEKGIGNYSFLYDKTIDYFTDCDDIIYNFYMNQLEAELKIGKDISYDNFIFIPLQVDNDSKLKIGSLKFKTVSEFLHYIINIYLKDFNGNIIIKKHPHDKRKIEDIVHIPKNKNIIDISNQNISKFNIIKKAKHVIGINTTFMMECIALNKPPITFGLDIFSNKGLTINGVETNFQNIEKIELNESKKFVFELMKRQINKKENFNSSIMNNCYWKEKLEKYL